MEPRLPRALLPAFVVALCCWQVSCAPAPQGPSTDELFAEGRRLDNEGLHNDAIAVYTQLLDRQPDSFDGHYWIARAMDLAGRYDEARQHFARALELSTESNREQTLRMMGIAWTFVDNGEEASRYFREVFDRRAAAGNPAGAAEVANELGRVYLELGDIDRAEEWYRTGHDTAAKEAGRSEAQTDLADLRWAHAQARVAARRGQPAEAQRQVAAVRALVEKGTNTDQEPQLAYLRGYVAFHLGDVDAAIEALQQADQSDPFILMLLAQAHERKGETAMAREYFVKVLESTSHAVNSAFARPVARRWLEAGRSRGGD